MDMKDFTTKTWDILCNNQANKELAVKFLRLDYQLTPQQVRMLVELGDGSVRKQTELSQLLDVDLGNMSRLCKQLEKRRYIKRQRSPVDARVMLIELDEPGLSLLRDVRDAFIESVVPHLEPYKNEELKTMVQGMDLYLKVLNRLRESLTNQTETPAAEA